MSVSIKLKKKPASSQSTNPNAGRPMVINSIADISVLTTDHSSGTSWRSVDISHTFSKIYGNFYTATNSNSALVTLDTSNLNITNVLVIQDIEGQTGQTTIEIIARDIVTQKYRTDSFTYTVTAPPPTNVAKNRPIIAHYGTLAFYTYGSGGGTTGYDAGLGFDKFAITGGDDDIALYDFSTSLTAANQTDFYDSQWHSTDTVKGYVVIDLLGAFNIDSIQVYRTATQFSGRGTPITFTLYSGSDWANAQQEGDSENVGSTGSVNSLVEWTGVSTTARFVKIAMKDQEYGHFGKVKVIA